MERWQALAEEAKERGIPLVSFTTGDLGALLARVRELEAALREIWTASVNCSALAREEQRGRQVDQFDAIAETARAALNPAVQG